MRKSQWIFALHVFSFSMTVLVSLSSVVLSELDWDFFTQVYLPWFRGLAVGIPATWLRVSFRPLKVWSAGCPLTVWENKERVKEGLEPYHGSCIAHYASEWTGWNITSLKANLLLLALGAFPFAIYFLRRPA